MAPPAFLPATRMIMTIFHNRPNRRQDNEITAEHASIPGSLGTAGRLAPSSDVTTIPLSQSVFLIVPAVSSSPDVVIERNCQTIGLATVPLCPGTGAPHPPSIYDTFRMAPLNCCWCHSPENTPSPTLGTGMGTSATYAIVDYLSI